MKLIQTYSIYRALHLITMCIITSHLMVFISHSQIISQRSISFNNFQPSSIQSNQNTPQIPSGTKYYEAPNIEMGMTGEDLIRQQEAQAMQRMGIVPPILPPSDPTQRHQFIKQQINSQYQSPNNELQKILADENLNYQEQNKIELYKKTLPYHAVFDELLKMNRQEIPFSLKKAVFMIENVYSDYTLKYSEFDQAIQSRVKEIRLIMKNEKISDNNNLGKNYAIQKLFSEKIIEYKDQKVSKVYQPFQYDFEDYIGINDWSKMFVSKLLKTGKGQCHSLPLLYLILAEEINAKAWLSLAPEHSFIQFSDNNRNVFYNFETTNGNAVSIDWLMESGYVQTIALKNKIYLDTLNNQGLISTLLADLLMGYTQKFTYDNFTISVIDSILDINPKSIQGQIFKADILTIKTNHELQKVGNPPIEEIQKYYQANICYNELIQQYKLIKNLGYIQMPSELYNKWLLSLDDEKNKTEKQKIKTEIITNVKKHN